jgi:hypothetical protein
MRSLICPVTGYLLGLDLGATSAAPLPLGVHSVALTSNLTWAVCSTGHAQLSYFRDISEADERPLMRYRRRMRRPAILPALRCLSPLRGTPWRLQTILSD